MAKDDDKPIMIYSTFGAVDDAERVGTTLIDEKLAACVNILPGVTSLYQWKGEVKKDREVVMLIKSRRARQHGVCQRIKSLHPYDTPVIFVYEGEAFGPDYWQWLCDQTGEVS